MAAKYRFWEIIQKFGGIIGILTSIATLVGFYLQTLEKKYQVEAKIISVDNLTSFSTYEGLKSIYYYKGKVVSNLFLVKIDFQNTGSEVIVGTGKNSNLLYDRLPFSFKDDIKVVDGPRINKGDFKIELSTLDSTNFFLSFEQWRPGESVSYSFYFSSTSMNPDFSPIIKSRPIINGNFIVTKYVSEKPKEREFLVQSFPNWVIFIILGVLFTLSILIIFGLFSDIYKNQKIKIDHEKWNKEIFPKFLAIVKRNSEQIIADPRNFKKNTVHQELNLEQRKRYLEDPKWLSSNFWNSYKLPERPSSIYNKDLIRTNLWGIFFVVLVFLILSSPYVRISWFN